MVAHLFKESTRTLLGLARAIGPPTGRLVKSACALIALQHPEDSPLETALAQILDRMGKEHATNPFPRYLLCQVDRIDLSSAFKHVGVATQAGHRKTRQGAVLLDYPPARLWRQILQLLDSLLDSPLSRRRQAIQIVIRDQPAIGPLPGAYVQFSESLGIRDRRLANGYRKLSHLTPL